MRYLSYERSIPDEGCLPMFRRNLSSLHNLLLLAALVTVSVFLAVTATQGHAAAPAAVLVRVVGPASPVRIGDQFAVTIQIEGAANLGAFEFEFGANPLIASTTVADIHLGEYPGEHGPYYRRASPGIIPHCSRPPSLCRVQLRRRGRSLRQWPTSHDHHAGDGARHEQPGLGRAQSHRRVGRGSICKQHQWRGAGSRQHSPAVSSPDSTRKILKYCV